MRIHQPIPQMFGIFPFSQFHLFFGFFPHINPALFQNLSYHPFWIVKNHLMPCVLNQFENYVLYLFVQLYCSVSVHPVRCAVVKFDREFKPVLFYYAVNRLLRLHRPFKQFVKSCLTCCLFLRYRLKIFCPGLFLCIFKTKSTTGNLFYKFATKNI